MFMCAKNFFFIIYHIPFQKIFLGQAFGVSVKIPALDLLPIHIPASVCLGW